MNKTILAAIIVIVMAALSGCSSTPDLLRYACDDDAVVITGSVADVLENGGWDISATSKFGPKLKSIFSDKKKNVPDCFDLSHCLITVNVGDNGQTVLMAVPLTSVSKFESFVEDDSPNIYRTRTERNGMIFYQMDPTSHLVIHDNALLLVGSRANSVEMPDELVTEALNRASERPLRLWQTEFLERDNTLNFLMSVAAIQKITASQAPLAIGYDPELIGTGYVCLTGSLDGPSAQISGQILDAEGNVLPNPLLNKKTDTDMLRYASNGSVAVAMIAVDPDIDWLSVLDQTFRTQAARSSGMYYDDKTISVIASVLENISGTVMLSIEPGNITKLSTPEGWGVTLAAQMKPETATSYVEMLQTLFDAEDIPYTVTDHGFEASFIGAGTLFVRTYGDTFFASTLPPDSPRGECKYVKASDFSDNCGAAIIRLPKGYPLLSILSINSGLEITYAATADQVTISTSVTDSDQPLLQALFSRL